MEQELEIKLKEAGKLSRLTNKTFRFDPKIGEGYYSANYFLKSREIVLKNAPGHIVEEQWFQRRDNTMVCGSMRASPSSIRSPNIRRPSRSSL
jgi:nicotinate phosphoribosyltransferase